MTTATLEQHPAGQDASAATPSPSTPRFVDFNISDALKSRLTNAGFINPTPVQAGAIPPAMEGFDILATAATGTGKTLSFLIPLMERLDEIAGPSAKGKRNKILGLILLPTRELAMQVLESYWKLMPGHKHDAALVCGGLSENAQFDSLDRGPRLVVATPGRLEDFLRRREIDLSHVDMFVLDEVDRMLDMGFLPAIRRIVAAVPRDRQTLCYSATLDANIQQVVKDYVKDPVRVEIGTTSKPSDSVELRAYNVMQDQKLGLLNQMLNEEQGTFLVFSRTKHGADRISRKLEKLGHDSNAIHGDRSQSQRTAALKGFATGRHRVLVATDVAARGIDVSDIAHVVNYDLPNASEDFVHRIGRTGRAGAKGVATTFVMPQEIGDARKMERALKIKFDWRIADKNLEKEERNKPLNLDAIPAQRAEGTPNDPLGALLALESRSWRGEGGAQPARNDGGKGGFRKRRSGHGHGNRPQAQPSHGNGSGNARAGKNSTAFARWKRWLTANPWKSWPLAPARTDLRTSLIRQAPRFGQPADAGPSKCSLKQAGTLY